MNDLSIKQDVRGKWVVAQGDKVRGRFPTLALAVRRMLQLKVSQRKKEPDACVANTG